MKRFLTLAIALIISLSVVGYGCKSDSDDGTQPEVIDADVVGSEENAKLPSTGEYLIKDGKTDYVIVYSEDAEVDILSAVKELNTFVAEATNGVKFAATTDNNVRLGEDSKFICIGQNSVWRDAGISVNADLGTDGTQMVTKNKSVYLFGNTAKAALYAVYDFLYYILDFDYMYKGVYSLDKNVKDVELKVYDIVNIPDIPIRTANYGWMETDATIMKRMRVVGQRSPFMIVGSGDIAHNSMQYVKNDIAEHEAFWRSDCGNQLCYTAHGNPQEYEALQQTCLNSLIAALKKDRTSNVVTLSQEDKATWCSCDACQSVINEYGATSAVVILFLNDLRDKLDAWFQSEEGQPYYRDLDILFFSYHKTNTAPVYYDASQGKYVANKGIHCKKGVAVWYAPIEADYSHSLLHEKNSGVLETLRGWSAVSDKMYLFFYSAPYNNYLVWLDTFNSMQDSYKLAKESGAQYLFDMGQAGSATVPFAWGALKSYLNAKLAWNVNADVNKLTAKFFKAAYGPVADKMYAYYVKQRVYLTWLSDNTKYSAPRFCSNPDIGKEEYWPKPVLAGWLNEINAIISDLDATKRTDTDLYNFYYKNVALERLSIYERWIDLYSYNTSADEIMQYKLQFIADAEMLKTGFFSEGGRTLLSLKQTWGID